MRNSLILIFLMAFLCLSCSDEPKDIHDLFNNQDWYAEGGFDPDAADYWIIHFSKGGSWKAEAHNYDGSVATSYLKYSGSYKIDWEKYILKITYNQYLKASTWSMRLKDKDPSLVKDICLYIPGNNGGLSNKIFYPMLK